jgi:hypothetical protein
MQNPAAYGQVDALDDDDGRNDEGMTQSAAEEVLDVAGGVDGSVGNPSLAGGASD